jgi:hypothetical protein
MAMRVTDVESVPTACPLRDFGPLLKRLRLRAGLSMNQLARESGVDPSYVHHIERPREGRPELPRRRIVLALWETLASHRAATADDRERMLVAAGLCPEVVLRAGGWDGYVNGIRNQVRAGLRAFDETVALALSDLGEDDDARE